jgi:hypothetical protein
MNLTTSHPAGLLRLAAGLAGAVVAVLLMPAVGSADPRAVSAPSLAGVPSLPGPLAVPARPAPQGVRLIRSKPDWGKIGTPFTIEAEKLPPNTDLDLVWNTANTSYLLDVTPENVQYFGRQLDPVSVVLGRARTDADGRLTTSLKAPRDFGGIHELYAVADGVQLAKGGFMIVRSVTLTPRRGPVGTPITIKVTGLGSHPYQSTTAVLYDNKYTGFISATNTRGTATVQIRAAGPVGTHAIEVAPASAAVPYLDIEQSAVSFVGKFRTTFTVTRDDGPPAAHVESPADVTPTVDARTTLTTAAAESGATLQLSAQRGPILSKVGVQATGLTPGASIDLRWGSAQGTRATASGWTLVSLPLQKGVADAAGRLTTSITIPDHLGGWHGVQLVQGGSVRAQAPYYVERSLVSISPTRVKVGEVFTIHIKGIGWTELDNAFAVTYDNGYMGYACGFYSNGDVTMNMVATGAPGTHLIDLYPTLYKGKAVDTWLEQVPILSFKQDAPGLALGYPLPAVRLAITVTK